MRLGEIEELLLLGWVGDGAAKLPTARSAALHRQVKHIAFHMRGARTEARFLAASLPARAKCPLGFIQHHIGLVYELIGGLIG